MLIKRCPATRALPQLNFAYSWAHLISSHRLRLHSFSVLVIKQSNVTDSIV